MSWRQLTVTGWALLTEHMDAETLERFEDELDAPAPASAEARRDRAALVKTLKGGR